jgi:hypothetical protein
MNVSCGSGSGTRTFAVDRVTKTGSPERDGFDISGVTPLKCGELPRGSTFFGRSPSG